MIKVSDCSLIGQECIQFKFIWKGYLAKSTLELIERTLLTSIDNKMYSITSDSKR